MSVHFALSWNCIFSTLAREVLRYACTRSWMCSTRTHPHVRRRNFYRDPSDCQRRVPTEQFPVYQRQCRILHPSVERIMRKSAFAKTKTKIRFYHRQLLISASESEKWILYPNYRTTVRFLRRNDSNNFFIDCSFFYVTLKVISLDGCT